MAGLIDSDGTNPKNKKNSIIFTQKNVEFIKQVQRLCWSLGFRANFKEYTYKSNFTKIGSATTSQLHISGNISQIPCKIKRKISSSIYCESKSPQRRGLSIKNVGKGRYFGLLATKIICFY